MRNFRRKVSQASQFSKLYDEKFSNLDNWMKIFFISFYLENLYKIENDEEFMVGSWVSFFDEVYHADKNRAQQIFTALPNELSLKIYSNLERKLYIQRKKRNPIKQDDLRSIEESFCYNRLIKVLFSS